MTPSKFLNNHITINHNFANVDWMVATYLVIWYSFIFTDITICK